METLAQRLVHDITYEEEEIMEELLQAAVTSDEGGGTTLGCRSCASAQGWLYSLHPSCSGFRTWTTRGPQSLLKIKVAGHLGRELFEGLFGYRATMPLGW